MAKKSHKGKHFPYSHLHRCLITIETERGDPPFTDGPNGTTVTSCTFHRNDGQTFPWDPDGQPVLLPSGRLAVFLIAYDPPRHLAAAKKPGHIFDDDSGYIVIATDDPATQTPDNEITVEPIPPDVDPCNPPGA